MPGISSFDPDRAKITAGKMGDARSELSPTWVAGLQTQQTPVKWGTQSGAQAFMTAYIEALGNTGITMYSLTKQAADLDTSTQQITSDATETDTDAAQHIQRHWKNHQTSPAPTPSGAPGTTTSTPAPGDPYGQ